MNLRLHSQAEAEVAEAAAHYEAISPVLRDGLEAELTRALRLLAEFPLIGAPLSSGRGLRRLVVDRFPYTLIYHTDGADLIVLAVAHQSRRPGYWRARAT